MHRRILGFFFVCGLVLACAPTKAGSPAAPDRLSQADSDASALRTSLLWAFSKVSRTFLRRAARLTALFFSLSVGISTSASTVLQR